MLLPLYNFSVFTTRFRVILRNHYVNLPCHLIDKFSKPLPILHVNKKRKRDHMQLSGNS